MVDIVVNHNAWPGPPEAVDFSALNPFNRPSDYHLPYCAVDYSDLTNDVSVHYSIIEPFPQCKHNRSCPSTPHELTDASRRNE